ncbi:MAG: hypothetical protein WCO09_01655, partial [bacterium]
PFIDLTKFLISYYGVAPDRSPDGVVVGAGTSTAGTSSSQFVPVGTGRVAPLNKPAPNGKNCI